MTTLGPTEGGRWVAGMMPLAAVDPLAASVDPLAASAIRGLTVAATAAPPTAATKPLRDKGAMQSSLRGGAAIRGGDGNGVTANSVRNQAETSR